MKPLKPKTNKAKYLLYFLISILIFLSIYSAYEFYNTHDFRSPILVTVQNPVPRKVIEIQSPVGSRSALIKQAYAEELKNPYTSDSPKGIAWEINKKEFGVEYWGDLEELVQRESSWNPFAINDSSGACGLSQSLPCVKMDCELWDYECQIKWMVDYIENRYDNPTNAIAFHNEKGWY